MCLEVGELSDEGMKRQDLITSRPTDKRSLGFIPRENLQGVTESESFFKRTFWLRCGGRK